MKSQKFEHEMTETSSIFGRKKDVKVVFKGDGAATDGGTVYLPAMAHEVEVDSGTQMVMRGYVDHEAGHVRHSDMPLILRKYQEWQEQKKPLLKGLHNAIEDIWLERKVRGEYLGSEKNISATASSVNKEFATTVKDDDAALLDWGQVGPVAITWEGRREYEGITHVDECLSKIDPVLAERVKEWVEDIDECESTQDNIDLAQKLYDEITKRKGKEKEDGDGGTGGRPEPQKYDDGTKPDDKGDDSKGDQETGAEGEERSEEPESGEGADGDEAEGDEGEGSRASRDEEGTEPDDEGADGDEGCSAALDDIEPVPFDASLKQGVDAAMKDGGLTTRVAGSYRPFTTEQDRVIMRSSTCEAGQIMGKGNERIYASDLREMSDHVSVMGRKLSRAFMAKRNRDWDGGREYGRLDSRRLVAAISGATHVFKQRTATPDVETAVQILCDMSGSMEGSRIVMARKVTAALCETLDRTTVAYEVLGFGTDEHRLTNEARRAYRDDRETWSRISPINIFVFKAFEERLSDSRASIGTMAKHNLHHNVDGESVLFGHERLMRRPEKRRIMMVLSDGNPEFSGNAGIDERRQHLRDVIAHITKEGTETVGIGIQTSAVKQFYPRYAVINRLSDLSKAALDQLAKLLIDEKFDVTSSDLIKAKRLG